MIETVLALLKEHGMPGIMIFACFGFIWNKEKTHRTERDEWRKQADKHSEDLITVIKENNNVIKDLTGVMKGIEGTISACKGNQ